MSNITPWAEEDLLRMEGERERWQEAHAEREALQARVRAHSDRACSCGYLECSCHPFKKVAPELQRWAKRAGDSMRKMEQVALLGMLKGPTPWARAMAERARERERQHIAEWRRNYKADLWFFDDSVEARRYALNSLNSDLAPPEGHITVRGER